jgi:rhodanese-related sulfurtransferase
MMIKLVSDRATGRLVGAQVIGGNGVDKRTDVFATAIAGRMTVFDLTNLDLAYAPPFGSAKDPAIVAGMVAQNAGREQLKLITPKELLRRLESGAPAQVLDVRPSYEHEMGAVPGAINIPVDEVRHRLKELNPAMETVVYDGNGSKAYLAARVLMQHGFASVRMLTGGYTLWPIFQALAARKPL